MLLGIKKIDQAQEPAFMVMLKQFWNDERGESSSASILLITTLLALGAVVGLTTARNSLVQQLGDVGVALENIDQSFFTPTSSFADPGPFPTDPVDAPPGCISLDVQATSES